MTFDIIVMQGHGQITDRHRYRIEGLRDTQPTGGPIDDAASLLRTHLSPDPAHCGSFHAAIAPSRGYVLHWRQPQPTSALAALLLDDWRPIAYLVATAIAALAASRVLFTLAVRSYQSASS